MDVPHPNKLRLTTHDWHYGRVLPFDNKAVINIEVAGKVTGRQAYFDTLRTFRTEIGFLELRAAGWGKGHKKKSCDKRGKLTSTGHAVNL